MTGTFQFKQFVISHSRAAFKVGTDGVLLGAAVDPGEAIRILDVGTGCGLIALMLAQKSKAQITGIDIDADSIDEARSNGQNSPWNERLNFIQIPLQQFVQERPSPFDLIVSNPPFFQTSLRSPDEMKNLAKHDVELNYADLLESTSKLLSVNGQAWFILPTETYELFLRTVRQFSLFESGEIVLFPVPGKRAHRTILSLNSQPTLTPKRSKLYIRNSNHTYTKEYMDLTRDYYLEF